MGILNNIKGKLSIEKSLADKAEELLNAKWTELKTAYTIYHMSVWESFLFYAGQSWIAWDENRKIWYPNTPTDEWVPRPKINRFSPTVDSISTNFGNIPSVEAIPNSDLNGDIRVHGICEIASALGREFLKTNGLTGDYKSQEDKAGLAAQLFVLAGNVFTKTYPEKTDAVNVPVEDATELFGYTCRTCDLYEESEEQPPPSCPHCGGPLAIEPITRNRPKLNPDSTPITDQEARYEIRCEIGNPVYAFPRAGAKSMGDTPYFIWADRCTLDWIYVHLDQYEADADSEFADGYSVTFEHALNYYYTGFSSSTLQSKDSALVLWLFVEPGKMKDFPDGMYAVMCNRKVIKSGTWNEFFVEHPYTLAGYMQLPTIFFARCVAFDLVEIQREKQSYESLIKLHAMTSAVSPIVQDENTVVTEITGRPDKVVKWRSIGPGSKEPHRMLHGSLDDGVYKQRQQLDAEFENISGAASVFRGNQPGSITAGNALETLKSQAEQMFAKPVQNWNALWRETVRKGVKNMQKFYTNAQIAEIVGPDRSSQIMDFKSCDLDKLIDWVAQQQSHARSRAERKKEMLELFDRGALDVNDVNVKANVYELWGETGMMKMFNADATRARYETKMMQQGVPAVVMVGIEDLAVHYQIHTEVIKGLEFERWEPQAKQLLMEHTLETKKAIMEEQMAQAAVQADKPGKGPAPKHGASPDDKKPVVPPTPEGQTA